MKTYLKSAHFTMLSILITSIFLTAGVYLTQGTHPVIEVPIVIGVFSLILLPMCSIKN